MQGPTKCRGAWNLLGGGDVNDVDMIVQSTSSNKAILKLNIGYASEFRACNFTDSKHIF